MNEFINFDNELKKLTILYVEDDKEERKLVADILRRRVKKIIEAKNGSEALLLFKKYHPDIILTDVMMPVMTGIELLQEVKRTHSDVEVILASAYDKRSYFIDAINAGANQFILKPFAQNRLVEALYSCTKKIIMERNFHRQQLFVQTILDFQENIIIVVNGPDIIAANKSFLDFFGYKSLKEFKMDKTHVNYFFRDAATHKPLEENWTLPLLKKRAYREVSAHPKETKNERTFLVKASDFPSHKNTYIVSFTDVTEMVQEHNALQWEVSVDPLTHIDNRNTFGKILEKELDEVDKYRYGIALILISIRNLKELNETVGIKKADALLVEIAELIKKKILFKDTLSRWFGAQFVVMTFGRDSRVLDKLAANLKATVEAYRFEAVAEPVYVDMDIVRQEDGDTYDGLMIRIEEHFEKIRRE